MNLRSKALASITTFGSLVVGVSVYFGLMTTVAVTPGCSDDGGKCKLEWADATLDDQTICASTAFTGATENLTNPFFPYATEGTVYVLQGKEDGETIRKILTIGATDTVAGVTVRVVNVVEYEDGVLIESTNDWYAQADDGTVCYFGEDVTNYEEDGTTNTAGSWAVDFTTNYPGIIMPKVADQVVGAIYIQERAPGVAEDMSEVTALDEPITVAEGTYTDTMTGNDCNPLDREGKDEKVYANGVGLVYDAGVELISITP